MRLYCTKLHISSITSTYFIILANLNPTHCVSVAIIRWFVQPYNSNHLITKLVKFQDIEPVIFKVRD